ncbi:heat shock protein beta-11-like [Planoprotostelium fungivorum]|uniref:Heat shock protein beta-11-like n=1 Tax=Planoprotostelium fungivorum TaxID=1890364 RepID=A0A2P6NR30_9EUKA|nr:heat shock protein beta-11-like [Planoprotostelium fungivorum]
MTPRSPRGSVSKPPRPTNFGNVAPNPLDKWLDAEKEVSILTATSNDALHPAENVLNGEEHTFWSTTGGFPQEIVLGFKQEIRIAEVRTVSVNIGSLSLQRVMPKKASIGLPEWKEVTVTEMSTDGADHQQVESHKMNNVSTRFLKIAITKSLDPFAAIYSIHVQNSDGKWLC